MRPPPDVQALTAYDGRRLHSLGLLADNLTAYPRFASAVTALRALVEPSPERLTPQFVWLGRPGVDVGHLGMVSTHFYKHLPIKVERMYVTFKRRRVDA